MSSFDTRGGAFNPFEGIPSPTRSNAAAKKARSGQPGSIPRLLGGGGYFPRMDLGIGGPPGGVPGQNGGQVTAMDQMAGALRQDIINLKSDVQDPYREQLDVFGGEVDAMGGEARGAIDTGMGILGDAMEGVKDPSAPDFSVLDDTLAGARANAGEIRADADAQYQETQKRLGAVDDLIKMALGRADLSVSAAKAAKAEYGGAVQANIRSAVSGMEARNERSLAMIEKGIGPDGQPLTASEQAQYRQQLTRDTNQQVMTTVAGLRDAADQTLAQLTSNIASTQMAAGQLTGELAGTKLASTQVGEQAGAQRGAAKLSAAQLEGEVGVQVGAARVQGQQEFERQKLAAQELRVGIANTMSSLVSAGTMQRLSLQLQGRTAMMEMISRFPTISLLEGYMAMMSVATAPGARNMRPINF